MKKAKWRQRLHGTCKWGGVTLCVLILALWVASGWYVFNISRYRVTGVNPGTWDNKTSLDIVGGRLELASEFPPSWPSQLHHWDGGIAGPWHPPPGWVWSFDYHVIAGYTAFQFGIPLWVPFLILAVPSAWLFWSDHRRRKRAGHCEKCGYDLTGNTSGKCPECGGPADGSATTEKAAST